MYNVIDIIDLSNKRNVYIVGDLHGCYDKLMKLLKEVKFDEDQDFLISVGDLIDRGDKCEECVLLVGKKWFKAVRGNHEQFCINSYYNPSLKESHSKKGNGGAWLYKLPYNIQKFVAQEFEKLPIAIEVHYKGKKYGVVHANVPFEDWEKFKTALITGDNSELDVKDYAMRNRDTFKKDYIHIKNIDHVYLGHCVSKGIKYIGNCSYIDTGAVFGKELTMIKLEP